MDVGPGPVLTPSTCRDLFPNKAAPPGSGGALRWPRWRLSPPSTRFQVRLSAWSLAPQGSASSSSSLPGPGLLFCWLLSSSTWGGATPLPHHHRPCGFPCSPTTAGWQELSTWAACRFSPPIFSSIIWLSPSGTSQEVGIQPGQPHWDPCSDPVLRVWKSLRLLEAIHPPATSRSEGPLAPLRRKQLWKERALSHPTFPSPGRWARPAPLPYRGLRWLLRAVGLVRLVPYGADGEAWPSPPPPRRPDALQGCRLRREPGAKTEAGLRHVSRGPRRLPRGSGRALRQGLDGFCWGPSTWR